MDLETARRSIHATFERMRVAYRQPVFDEWAILSVPAASGGVVAYAGPRPDAFKVNLARAQRRRRGESLPRGTSSLCPTPRIHTTTPS